MELIILVTTIVLFVAYAMLIIYYRQSWLAIANYRPAGNQPPPSTIITVIIPARNEAENIKACLDALCGQSYPSHLFEVLVIDDYSSDATAEMVTTYPAPNVRLISLAGFTGENALNSYKKKAIETAIGESKGELMVTTDADCIVPSQWLQTIAFFYKEHNAALIAMPVSYDCRNNFLDIFQSLDFMTLQGITGAAVFKKVHSMCNGANLAYSKKAFLEAGGFTGIDHIASGDDMLLMHKIFKQTPERVFFLKSREVIVHTRPMDTLRGFFNQRIRWASKADKYEDKRIFAVLLVVYFLNVWIILLGVGSIFFPLARIFLYLLAAKTIIELYFLYPVARFFNKQQLLWWFPVAQPFHIFYTIIAGWLGKFGQYTWKERIVH